LKKERKEGGKTLDKINSRLHTLQLRTRGGGGNGLRWGGVGGGGALPPILKGSLWRKSLGDLTGMGGKKGRIFLPLLGGGKP